MIFRDRNASNDKKNGMNVAGYNTPYLRIDEVSVGKVVTFLEGQRVNASSFCASLATSTFSAFVPYRRHSMSSTLTSAYLDPLNDHDACWNKKGTTSFRTGNHQHQVIQFMDNVHGSPGLPIYRTTKNKYISTRCNLGLHQLFLAAPWEFSV